MNYAVQYWAMTTVYARELVEADGLEEAKAIVAGEVPPYEAFAPDAPNLDHIEVVVEPLEQMEKAIEQLKEANLRGLAETMRRAAGCMVATFDVENDPYHPIQAVTFTPHPPRVIIWLQPNAALDANWKPFDLLSADTAQAAACDLFNSVPDFHQRWASGWRRKAEHGHRFAFLYLSGLLEDMSDRLED